MNNYCFVSPRVFLDPERMTVPQRKLEMSQSNQGDVRVGDGRESWRRRDRELEMDVRVWRRASELETWRRTSEFETWRRTSEMETRRRT